MTYSLEHEKIYTETSKNEFHNTENVPTSVNFLLTIFLHWLLYLLMIIYSKRQSKYEYTTFQ